MHFRALFYRNVPKQMLCLYSPPCKRNILVITSRIYHLIITFADIPVILKCLLNLSLTLADRRYLLCSQYADSHE